ncbi:hypothetical protein NDU88_001016 [Pleurodeles waltl]|uniref:Uncharacterized protein n=1 Tax=Pleurodeles waltl TaxID=8319 RepID=A0AAV7U6P8_PLEWA|nr:hypothetical protein NDU88_001016 [Pleurodeles waltl]
MNSMPGRRCDQDVRSALCGQGSGRTSTLLQYATHAERGKLLSVSWPGWGSESRVLTATRPVVSRWQHRTSRCQVVCGVPRPRHSRTAPKQDAAPRHHGPDPVLIELSPLVRGVWAQAGKQLRRPRAAGSGDPQRWVGRGTTPDPAPPRLRPSRGDRQRAGSGVRAPQAPREIQAQSLRAAPRHSRAAAEPARVVRQHPAVAVGVGPAAQQLPDRAEGSNSVRNEAAASGMGPGQLGGRHLTREE